MAKLLDDSNTKKNSTKIKKKSKEKSMGKKNGLWVKFRIFCNGVRDEFKKVHWPSRSDMLKYSIATIIFIIFFALFFYLIEVLFALFQTIFN